MLVESTTKMGRLFSKYPALVDFVSWRFPDCDMAEVRSWTVAELSAEGGDFDADSLVEDLQSEIESAESDGDIETEDSDADWSGGSAWPEEAADDEMDVGLDEVEDDEDDEGEDDDGLEDVFDDD
jgi:hypothetical protein